MRTSEASCYCCEGVSKYLLELGGSLHLLAPRRCFPTKAIGKVMGGAQTEAWVSKRAKQAATVLLWLESC